MITVPGELGKDFCDPHLRLSRRDILKVGGAGMLGMSLGSMFEAQAVSAVRGGGPGWGKAKNIILLYLQGGPSHLDLWDPKKDVPDNVRSAFKTIPTKVPGVHFTEIMPELAKVNDKFSMIRSMPRFSVCIVPTTATSETAASAIAVERSPSVRVQTATGA